MFVMQGAFLNPKTKPKKEWTTPGLELPKLVEPPPMKMNFLDIQKLDPKNLKKLDPGLNPSGFQRMADDLHYIQQVASSLQNAFTNLSLESKHVLVDSGLFTPEGQPSADLIGLYTRPGSSIEIIATSREHKEALTTALDVIDRDGGTILRTLFDTMGRGHSISSLTVNPSTTLVPEKDAIYSVKLGVEEKIIPPAPSRLKFLQSEGL